MSVDSQNSNSFYIKLVLLLLTAVIGVSLFKALPLLFPTVDTFAEPEPDCNLRQSPCTAKFPSGGQVSLSIEPRSIPLVTPLDIRVELQGVDANLVQVDFQGVDMNMGFNRVNLENTAANAFSGKSNLPVCVRDKMTWEAQVMIHTKSGLMIAPFQFETYSSLRP
ncbi:MAG: hypothetical protein ACWA5Q_09980 [bacterium]